MEIYSRNHHDDLRNFTEQNYFIHSNDNTYPLKNISFAKLFNSKPPPETRPFNSKSSPDANSFTTKLSTDTQSFNSNSLPNSKSSNSNSLTAFQHYNSRSIPDTNIFTTKTLPRTSYFGSKTQPINLLTNSKTPPNASNEFSQNKRAPKLDAESRVDYDQVPIFSSTPRSVGSSKLNLVNNSNLKSRSYSYSHSQVDKYTANAFVPNKQPLKRSYSDTEKFQENTRRDFDELSQSIESLLSERLRHSDDVTSPHNTAPNFNAFLHENWQQVLRDLDAAGRLDSKLLEAIYLLRNAHKSGFLQNYWKLNVPIGLELQKDYQVEDTKRRHDSFSSDTDRHELTSSNDSLISASLPSSVLYSSLSDSLPSSGRSTPTVRKRPKCPDIKITHHKDYVEIRRPDSIYSVTSDDESTSNDADFIDVSDDMIVKAIWQSELLSAPPKSRYSELSELEETLRDDTPIPKNNMESNNSENESLILSRPGSPTSEFLQPLLINGMKSDFPKELYDKLSPLLHRLSELEDNNKKYSMLEMKFAFLEDEKRRTLQEFEDRKKSLTRSDISVTEFATTRKTRDVGVQKYLEIITPIAHKETSTETKLYKSVGINPDKISQNNIATQQCIFQTDFSCQFVSKKTTHDQATYMEACKTIDKGTGDEVAYIDYSNHSQQFSPVMVSIGNQYKPNSQDFGNMYGVSWNNLNDTGVGCSNVNSADTSTQSEQNNSENNSSQTETIKTCDSTTEAGCPFSNLTCRETQIVIETRSFSCGDNAAEIETVDKSTDNTYSMADNFCQTHNPTLKDAAVNSTNSVTSVAIGDGNVFDIICDVCSNKNSRDFACGTYVNLDPCCIDDKLCDCVKPITMTTASGDYDITDSRCDKCRNLSTKNIGVGDSRIDDIICEKCANLTTKHVAIGDDKIDDLLCDQCVTKSDTCDKSIGDSDVTLNPCEICNGNVFNFNFKTEEKTQIPICHYCGNKVDLDDDVLDESLTAMRESMRNISSGLQRSNVNMRLNFDQEETNFHTSYRNQSSVTSVKESDLESPASDEYRHPLSDDEEEVNEESGRNDVIEACQKLHEHFSGSRPLTKAVMLKYMGIVQTLWFKCVKKRRANASVVKSYLDLFHQRVPELLETIVNMTDDEGNTALHYALTYKNFGVASILLDSGECSVDNVNQAGYSPIMLAALAGFERKNDKYVMQRLLRMGDINKESTDTGQTPLMLAVSRGNLGVVEMLLDAGCDINALDDEGSTALMCACEHGSIQIVKALLANPDCDATIEDNEGSTALSIAMDSRRKDLALLIYGSLNFDSRGKIKLSPSKQSLLGLGRRSPSPVIGRK